MSPHTQFCIDNHRARIATGCTCHVHQGADVANPFYKEPLPEPLAETMEPEAAQ